MFYRLKDALNRKQLNRVLSGILKTPSLTLDKQSDFTVISQIRENDLLMYLLAVKSFCQWQRPRQIYLLADGNFSKKSRQVLGAQIPQIVFELATRYRDERCPTGGCWERLLALVSHAQDSYVVQLDADTITLGLLREVRSAISTKNPFTLGSRQGQRAESSEVIASRAKESLRNGDTHVQTLSESILDKFMPSDTIRYVRGCAAFVGIPPGKVSLESVAGWAHELGRLVGPRWNEWGTEQFMSNLLIANMEGCVILPHPRYATCPNVDEECTLFAHMAGFCRFSNHLYARLAQRAFAML